MFLGGEEITLYSAALKLNTGLMTVSMVTVSLYPGDGQVLTERSLGLPNFFANTKKGHLKVYLRQPSVKSM